MRHGDLLSTQAHSLEAPRGRPMKASHGAGRDIYLTANVKHLMLAVASSLARGGADVVVYLDDHMAAPQALLDKLSQEFPKIRFIRLNDSKQAAQFAGIAEQAGIVRRNMRLRRGRLIRPWHWVPDALKDLRFATGYIYHPGFFMAKSLRGICDEIVLREDGLSNYMVNRPGAGKGLLRLLSRQSPFRHILGDEKWIDRLEVARPDALPPSLRPKVSALSVHTILNRLDETTRRKLAQVFWQADGSPVTTLHGHGALLLTQPIDKIGRCSLAEKISLYEQIAARLSAKGLVLWVKHHPLDVPFPVPGAQELPALFPIEAWPCIQPGRFDLAVALCSASLEEGAETFSQKQLQLVHPNRFRSGNPKTWAASITGKLDEVPQSDG